MTNPKRQITVVHELDNGDTQELKVEYSINRYYPETRETPSEGGDVEIHSCTENGVEIDVSDKLYNLISEKAFENEANFERVYYED